MELTIEQVTKQYIDMAIYQILLDNFTLRTFTSQVPPQYVFDHFQRKVLDVMVNMHAAGVDIDILGPSKSAHLKEDPEYLLRIYDAFKDQEIPEMQELINEINRMAAEIIPLETLDAEEAPFSDIIDDEGNVVGQAKIMKSFSLQDMFRMMAGNKEHAAIFLTKTEEGLIKYQVIGDPDFRTLIRNDVKIEKVMAFEFKTLPDCHLIALRALELILADPELKEKIHNNDKVMYRRFVDNDGNIEEAQ